MHHFKRLSALFLAFLISVTLFAGVQAPASADDEEVPQLISDGTYEYSRQEGFCVSAEEIDGNVSLDFRYAVDDDMKPLERYIGRDLYERYEYDADGNLCVLTVYEDENEPVVRYYENGVLTAVLNDAAAVAPRFACTDAVYLSWDDEGRLVSALCCATRSESEITRLFEAEGFSEADVSSCLAEMTPAADPATGEYILETYEYVWDFDENGKVTSLTETDTISALENYRRYRTQDAQDIATVYSLNFEYTDDAMLITYSSVRKGDPDTELIHPSVIEYSIERNAQGLPVSVMGNSFSDIYGSTGCTVESAEIGYWAVTYDPAAVNCYGELHGGLLGFIPDLTLIGRSDFCLKISGTDADGKAVEYLFTPDPYGRSFCIKTVDGLPVRMIDGHSSMDMTKRSMLYIDAAPDYVYAG